MYVIERLDRPGYFYEPEDRNFHSELSGLFKTYRYHSTALRAAGALAKRSGVRVRVTTLSIGSPK